MCVSKTVKRVTKISGIHASVWHSNVWFMNCTLQIVNTKQLYFTKYASRIIAVKPLNLTIDEYRIVFVYTCVITKRKRSSVCVAQWYVLDWWRIEQKTKCVSLLFVASIMNDCIGWVDLLRDGDRKFTSAWISPLKVIENGYDETPRSATPPEEPRTFAKKYHRKYKKKLRQSAINIFENSRAKQIW